MPAFKDVGDFPWAAEMLDKGFEMGIAQGVGNGSLFGAKPDDETDVEWYRRRFDKVQTLVWIVRGVIKATLPWRGIVKGRRPSVLRIQSAAGVGTACVCGRINGQLVAMTAAHVVLDSKGQPTAGFAQRIDSPAETRGFSIVDVSHEHDLAVITCPFAELPVAPLGQDPQQGDWLLAISCGAGIYGREVLFIHGPQITGTVNGVTQMENADSALVQPGDSGGPVFDTFGYRVNVISGTLPGDTMTLVMPTSALRGYEAKLGVI